MKFDDVPEKYRHQVNINSIPYHRRQGDEPALTDQDVEAIVAFLGTLTDAAYRKSKHREGKRNESSIAVRCIAGPACCTGAERARGEMEARYSSR